MKKKHEKRERIVKKKGFAKIGVFFLGILFGFIFTIGALVGTGFWAYKNLTLNKIEKLTNSKIDVGNDSIKKITLEDVVSNISGIANDKNYTIEKMENDFGITIIGEGGFVSDEFYGLDLTPLKQSTFKNLKSGIEDIVGNANINTFLSFLEQDDDELGVFANILNSEIDFYYNSITQKLYKTDEYTTEVPFDYEIDGNQVKLNSDKDTTYTIENNILSVPFRKVAIESAFSSFDKVTDNLQIYELLDYHYNSNNGRYYEDEFFSKELDGFMKTLAPKTIKEISSSSFFDNLKIYEVFGYFYDGTNYYNYYDGTSYSEQVTLEGIEKALAQKSINDLTNDGSFDDVYIYDVLNLHVNADGKYCEKGSDTPVTGVLNAIAGKTIGQLSSDTTYNNIYIYEVMNYTRSGTNPNYTYTDKSGNTVDGVLGAIAGSTISSLSDDINGIKLKQILNLTDSETGVLKALSDTRIDELNGKINGLKLYEVLGFYYDESLDEADRIYYKDKDMTQKVTGVLITLANSNVNTIGSDLEALTLGQALGINKTEAKGAILSFYETPINQLDDELNPENLYIYKAMGYTRTGTEGNYTYTDSEGQTVTGVMATLAGFKLDKVEDAIDAIKITDVLDLNSPIIKLLDDGTTNLNTITISNLSSKIVDKMNVATVGELIDCGLITDVTLDENSPVRNMTIKTLIETAVSYS